MRPLAPVFALCLAALAAQGAGAQPPVAVPGHGMIRAPVKSYYELRFRNVVRQSFDLSCGAAALATIMKYYYGIDTTEKDVVDRILKDASDSQKKKIADVRKLSDLRVPAITLSTVRGYNHFVVIKGVRNGIVHIADPAFGNRARTFERFAESWNNVVLVFVDRNRQPRNAFTFDDVNVTPTREVVVITDRLLRGFARGAGEF